MKIIFSTSIFLIFINVALVFVTTSFANNCSDHSVSDPSVPLCPEGPGVLSEIYPVRMATVSTHFGRDFAGNFVSELFASQPNKPPAVVVSGKAEDCEYAKRMVARRAPASRRELWVSNVQCNPESEWNWQQDFMQAYVNSSGESQVRFNPQYRGGQGRTAYQGIPGRVQDCGFAVNETGTGTENAYMGGNIEGMPPDFCVIGDNVPTEDRSSLCNGAQNIMVAPTSFMLVGHVDEIMKTVQTNGSPPCNFKVLVGSVDLAKELMASAPADDNFIPQPTQSTSQICGFETEAGMTPGSGRGSRTTTWNLLWKYLKADLAFANPSRSPRRSAPTPSSRPAPEEGAEDDSFEVVTCTPKKFLQNLESTELGPRNETISAELNGFANSVNRTMRSKFPQCGNMVERVPMLFDARHENDALSIFPNPTNGVNINGTMIYSDPNNTVFDKYLTDLSQRIGVRKRTVNTEEAHANEGNLHCSTNLLRYCRPRSR